MSHTTVELGIAPFAEATSSETPYGEIPHGDVAEFRIAGRPVVHSGRVRTGDVLVRCEVELPDPMAEASYDFLDRFPVNSLERTCHAYAHTASGLYVSALPSNNLIVARRLLIDPRDTTRLQPTTELTPGKTYAVGDGESHADGYAYSEHSMVAVSTTGLVFGVNGSGGNLITTTAAKQVEDYGGTHLLRLDHPSPALGTTFWYDRTLTSGDDRPMDMIIADMLAAAEAQRPANRALRAARALLGLRP
jgi:hypothetical protein